MATNANKAAITANPTRARNTTLPLLDANEIYKPPETFTAQTLKERHARRLRKTPLHVLAENFPEQPANA